MNNNALYKIKNFVFKNANWVFIFALLLFVAIKLPLFFSVSNLMSLGSQIAVLGIASIGMTLLILTGVTDISVGQQIYLAGVISVKVYQATNSMVYATIAAMLVCGVVGAINGVLIASIGLPSMIVTLSMQQVCNGAASILIGEESVINVGNQFSALGSGKLGDVPISVIIFLVLFVIGAIISNRTKFGHYIFAIGNNSDAVAASGINVFLIREIIFIATGMLAGFAGVINASRIGGVQFGMGVKMEFNAIAAAVVGGTSMQGGRGNMWGTLIGVMIIGSIDQLMRMFNINVYLYNLVWGLIVLLTVGCDLIKQKELENEKEHAARLRAIKQEAELSK